MTHSSQLALVKEMIESAEASLRSAKQILHELVPSGETPRQTFAKQAAALPQSSEGGSIIEGVFDGQNMVGPDSKTYPIPANYASKSKLVQGDVLKLTIMPDGAFLYKQIGPVERKRATGPLVYEDGQYKVLAGAKAYKVLLASVTYHRAEVGDQVTVMVPEFADSAWGAIEHVLPKQDVLGSSSLDEFTAPMEPEVPVKKKRGSKKE